MGSKSGPPVTRSRLHSEDERQARKIDSSRDDLEKSTFLAASPVVARTAREKWAHTCPLCALVYVAGVLAIVWHDSLICFYSPIVQSTLCQLLPIHGVCFS